MSPTLTSVLTTCPETWAATSDASSGMNVPVARTTTGMSRLKAATAATGTEETSTAADASALARASLPRQPVNDMAETTTASAAIVSTPNVRMIATPLRMYGSFGCGVGRRPIRSHHDARLEPGERDI